MFMAGFKQVGGGRGVRGIWLSGSLKGSIAGIREGFWSKMTKS